MRCNLAPDKALNTEAVIMYIIQQPRRTDLMVSRDFNADLVTSEGNDQDKEIATSLATAALEDTIAHFLP